MNAHESLPVHPPSRELEPANPVLDAELIDDTPDTVSQHRLRDRVASWWLRSPRVPSYLKNRAALQASKDLLVAFLRFPWRYAGAVVRGVVAAARWWRRWVTVRDYREAAELAEKLADKFVEIRALTLFRWKVTGAVAVAAAAAVLVVDLVFGARGLWLLGGCVSVALAILGRRQEGSPGRKAVLAGPRSLTWTMDRRYPSMRSGTRSSSARTRRYAWSNGLRGSVPGGRSRSTCRPPARPPTSSRTGKRSPPRWPWTRRSSSSSGCAATAGTPGGCQCGSPTRTPTPRPRSGRRCWAWSAGMPGGLCRSAGMPVIAGEFVPTAELVDVLDVEPNTFARQMGELGCRPTRNRIPTDDRILLAILVELTEVEILDRPQGREPDDC